MGLTQTIITALNDLPGFPNSLSFKLGDLLDSMGVPNPSFAAGRTIFVEATGSDTTGDGLSVATAFATPQKAVDSVPWIAAPGTRFVIQCGAGTFAAPDTSRIPPHVYVQIFANRTNRTFLLSGGAWALVGGKAGQRTNNVGAYADTVTDTSHWGVSDFSAFPGFGDEGFAVRASTSPNLVVCDFQAPTAFGEASVYPFETTFTVPDKQLIKGPQIFDLNGGLMGDHGVAYNGIVFSGTNIILANVQVTSCRFDGPSFLYDCWSTGSNFGSAIQLVNSTASPFFSLLNSLMRNTTRIGGQGVNANGTVFAFNGPKIALGENGVDMSSLLVGATDFEGTGACIEAKNGFVTQFGNITVASAASFISNSFLGLRGYSRTGGIVTGAVTGTAVQAANGGQLIGIKAACNGTLTAGVSEVIVGGNAGATFASLPATDAGAVAPQFCRAT